MSSTIFNGDYVKLLKDKLKFKLGGVIEWDHVNGCPSYPSDIAGVNNQIGQEIHVRVYNPTGSVIPNGAIVYVEGVDPDGAHPSVMLAIANDYVKSRVLGMVTADIPSLGHGIVTREGLVNGLDTSALSSGDTLFLSPTVAGAYQTGVINDGNFDVRVGVVVKDDATTGSILVCHTAAHYTVETTQKTGWSNEYGPATLSFDNGTRTLTITPVGADFHFYQDGTKYAKTTDSYQIADTEGIHAIYYNLGVLTSVVNPTNAQIESIIRSYPSVAYVGWNATDNEAVYFGNELHDMQFPDLVHVYAHFAFGARYLNGLALTDILSEENGSIDSHAQFGVESGAIADEDRYIPTATIASTTGLPIFYLAGTTAAPVLRRLTNAGFSVSTTGTGRLAYNFLTGGNWTIAEVTSTNFVLCHVFCINENDIAKRMVAFMGQAQYATVALARAGAESEITALVSTGIVPKEIKSIGTVIFQTSNAYANAVKARIREVATGIDYEDWRSVNNTGGSVATSGSGTTIFSDADFQVFDNVDPTKSFQFQASPITTGTNAILTVPPATDTLAGLAAVQSFTNKTIEDSLTVKQVATPSTPAAGYNKRYPKADGIERSLLPSGKEIAIDTKGDYEFLWDKQISDFVAYNDGSSAIPVDGTGGVASYVSVASSPSPIDTSAGILNLRISKTANNAQGEGIAVDFTTRGERDKYGMRTCRINIKGSANSADNDFGCYLIPLNGSDLTLKYPADQNIKASSFVSSQQFEFQLTDGTSYRLMFHCQSTSALAYDLDVVVNFVENKKSTGGIVNWPSYTMTATSATAGWATQLCTGIPYKTINGDWRLRFNVIANVTSATLVTTTADLSGVIFKNIDRQAISAHGNSTSAAVSVAAAIANTGSIVINHASATISQYRFSGDVALESKPSWAVDYSNQVLSEDAGNRKIVTTLRKTASQTGVNTNNNYAKVTWGSAEEDTAGAANIANSRIDILESGSYDVDLKLATGATNILAARYWAVIYKNGAIIEFGTAQTATATKSQYLECQAIALKLVKGDYLEAYIAGEGNNSASTYSIIDGMLTKFTVAKRSSPQQIAASEKVVGVYTSNTAQALSNGTPAVMVYEDKVIDTHNCYTPATGGVSPMNGYLTLQGAYQLAGSSAWGANEFQEVLVEINGSAIAFRDFYSQQPTGTWNAEPVSISVNRWPILKGQTFRVRGRQDSGSSISTTGLSAANYINFSIEA